MRRNRAPARKRNTEAERLENTLGIPCDGRHGHAGDDTRPAARSASRSMTGPMPAPGGSRTSNTTGSVGLRRPLARQRAQPHQEPRLQVAARHAPRNRRMVDPDTRAPDQFPISRPAGTVQPAASCIERPHQLANRPRDQDAIPAAIRRLKRRNAFKQQTEFMRDAMPTRHRPDARRDISHVQDRTPAASRVAPRAAAPPAGAPGRCAICGPDSGGRRRAFRTRDGWPCAAPWRRR